MTEGLTTVAAKPRLDPIDLAIEFCALTTAAQRIATLQRLMVTEAERAWLDHTASRQDAVAYWRIANEMMAAAVAELEQVQARLASCRREVCRAVGAAADRT